MTQNLLLTAQHFTNVCRVGKAAVTAYALQDARPQDTAHFVCLTGANLGLEVAAAPGSFAAEDLGAAPVDLRRWDPRLLYAYLSWEQAANGLQAKDAGADVVDYLNALATFSIHPIAGQQELVLLYRAALGRRRLPRSCVPSPQARRRWRRLARKKDTGGPKSPQRAVWEQRNKVTFWPAPRPKKEAKPTVPPVAAPVGEWPETAMLPSIHEQLAKTGFRNQAELTYLEYRAVHAAERFCTPEHAKPCLCELAYGNRLSTWLGISLTALQQVTLRGNNFLVFERNPQNWWPKPVGWPEHYYGRTLRPEERDAMHGALNSRGETYYQWRQRQVDEERLEEGACTCETCATERYQAFARNADL